MKNYVGRKCKGFSFEDGIDDVNWARQMETHIGEIGEITKQGDSSVRISFKNNWWGYPTSLIEEHLIPEIPEIPQLGEGVEMEVSDDGVRWNKRKVIAKMNTGWFIISNGTIWKHARPIQEVKKYTKEELVKIVGHDFEII
jgi:hypothetical protein